VVVPSYDAPVLWYDVAVVVYLILSGGVTLHRRSGRWESHIWVRETGRQLYLGMPSIPYRMPRHQPRLLTLVS